MRSAQQTGGVVAGTGAAGSMMARLGFGCVGTVAFCIYARSWQDWGHLVYDIPANLAVFAFIGELVIAALRGQRWVDWWCRFALVVAMTAVTVGRAYLHWNISGHLSCVGAVALVQWARPELRPAERWFYLFPLPLVLALRWLRFDHGDHWQTYSALIFGGIAAGIVISGSRLRLA
jgi:hypothetical protein